MTTCIHELEEGQCDYCAKPDKPAQTVPGRPARSERSLRGLLPAGVDGVLLFAPYLRPDIIEFVHGTGGSSSKAIGLALASVGNAKNVKALEALLFDAEDVRVLAINPVDVSETMRAAAWSVGAEYELARLSIPVHYQNLRDNLASRYGFTQLRDVQLLGILRANDQVQQLQDGVFKAAYRTRLEWPRETLNKWADILSAGRCDNIANFSDMLNLLEEWYSHHPGVAGAVRGVLSSLPKHTIAESRGNGRVTTAFRRAGNAQLLFDSTTDTSFMRHTEVGHVLAPLLHQLDDTLLASYRGAAEVAAALANRPSGRVGVDSLVDYARLWTDCIATKESKGQEQKWRGWYLVPEHGSLTIEKLRELKRIAAEIAVIADRGTVLVDRSTSGIENVQHLLRAGHVTYAKLHSESYQRDLFIRQQKNYLVRLGIAVENPPNYLALTRNGLTWVDATSDSALVAAFHASLLSLRWSWCNMPFFGFARDLAAACQGFLTYEELANWVIHAYGAEHLNELTDAIYTYRGLSNANKRLVNSKIAALVESRINQFLNSSAFGHYRRKVTDMMIAFTTSGVFSLDGTAGPGGRIELAATLGRPRRRL